MACDAPATSLHGVALAGEEDEVRTLVSRGVPLQGQDAGGWTALHYAAAADRPSTTSALLQLGADPSVSTAAVPTLTPLHLAVSCRSGEGTLRQLIEHSAPLDARDELGQTALHLAVSMRDVSAVRILLEAVRCLLTLALASPTPSPCPTPHLSTRAIPAQGASPTVLDKYDRSPLAWSRLAGWNEASRLLYEVARCDPSCVRVRVRVRVGVGDP